MKQAILTYFDGLKYQVTSQTDDCVALKQKRTGLEVELDFSVMGKRILPESISKQGDKKLVFLDLPDIEAIGFEAIEHYSLTLDPHTSLMVLEDDYFEQIMKDIWMFLSNDPRNRDVFSDSKYY